MKVRTVDWTDVTSWCEIWEAAEVANVMCVKKRLLGQATDIGMYESVAYNFIDLFANFNWDTQGEREKIFLYLGNLYLGNLNPPPGVLVINDPSLAVA